MNPLDELQKTLCGPGNRDWPPQDIDAEFQAFAIAHPFFGAGICDPECQAYQDGGSWPDWCAVRYLSLSDPSEAPTGKPCPVLKGRK